MEGRKNLFELISGNNVNIKIEYMRIYALFENRKINGYTLLEKVKERFLLWEHRGRYISAGEMMIYFDITHEEMEKNINMQKLLLYLEFVYNMLKLLDGAISIREFQIVNTLIENINTLLDDLNYEMKNKKGQNIICEKDNLATAIAETKPEISNEVIEYRRFSMRGNIETKRLILKVLIDKIEPLKKKFKGSNFSNYIEDIGALANNLNIRHNNEDGKNKKEYLINMTKEEIEEWYDIMYDMILGIFELEKYLDNKEKIKELRMNLK